MPPAPQSQRQRQHATLALLGTCALFAVLVAGLAGSVPVPLHEVPGALGSLLAGAPDGMAATLLDLRLGRASSAFVTGAALALAGVMMQALVRNPLADPYVLGVSAGAAVGALAALLFGAALWAVDLGAFGGAIAVSLLLYLLARRDLSGMRSGMRGGGQGGTRTGESGVLLLTGVVLASACMALVTLMLSVAPESRLRGMVFWMIGDLAGTSWRLLPWVVLVAALVLGLRRARALNIMALHTDAAVTLGVDVVAQRRFLFICSGLLTACAVTTGGSIGFVGLVVPHACRHAFGPDHRILLPAAALAGGSFLVLADTLARTVLAPQQLPVGVLTSLIGVPVFLFQLHQLHLRRR
ncbi:FecCD family ABC transporter permease [Massilia niabensis]|uniref:FecCD family ABC transporter permease n=1 Tax=Massilia niabensis TaxID=544910 RepID=A0ABW0LDE4_9BURK